MVAMSLWGLLALIAKVINMELDFGSALSNIEQSIQGLIVFDESELKTIKRALFEIEDNLDEVLPQLIDKKHTYLFSNMSRENAKNIIGSFIEYFMFLPKKMSDNVHIDTLAPDDPGSVKEMSKFTFSGAIRAAVKKEGFSKIQEKYVFGEALRESNYILQALFQRIPGIKYVFVNAPGYISVAGTRDSLTPSTAKQENNLRQSTILKDRDDITR